MLTLRRQRRHGSSDVEVPALRRSPIVVRQRPRRSRNRRGAHIVRSRPSEHSGQTPTGLTCMCPLRRWADARQVLTARLMSPSPLRCGPYRPWCSGSTHMTAERSRGYRWRRGANARRRLRASRTHPTERHSQAPGFSGKAAIRGRAGAICVVMLSSTRQAGRQARLDGQSVGYRVRPFSERLHTLIGHLTTSRRRAPMGVHRLVGTSPSFVDRSGTC
jgi:hypothetical protein